MALLLIILMYLSLFITFYWIQVIFVKDSKIGKLKTFPKVTVAIPAYNEESGIAQTISSVLSLDYPKNKLEIIVVDDGSTDKTREIVAGFKNVRLITQRQAGKAAALNNALRNSNGEFFACLDADSRVEKDALKNLIHHFSDKEVASVIAAIKVEKPETLWGKFQWHEYLMSAFARRLMSRVNSLNMTPGVFSFYRKEVLSSVGGFDEKNITEDFEIAMRLHKNGYKVKIENKSVGYTNAPQKFSSLVKQRERWARGYIYNGFKYKEMFFNKKYGILGTFHLPVTLLTLGILMFTSIFTIFKLTNFMLNALFDIIELKTLFFRLIEIPNWLFILTLDYILYLPIIIGFGLALYSFYKARGLAREKLRYPFAFIAYLAYFGFFHSYVWLRSITKEIAKAKRIW